MPEPARTAPPSWPAALGGDRDAFEAAVAPHQDALMRAAEREVALRVDVGDLGPQALAPAELVGETLVRAWDRRRTFSPARLSMRAWLLGIQHRRLAQIVADEARYVRGKAVALDESVAVGARHDADEGSLYEFRQPFENLTYADLLAGSQPIDVEFDPTGNEPLDDAERAALDRAGLSTRTQTAVLLHDELHLTVAETAQILDASLKDTAQALNLARASVRQRFGPAPAPPPSPATDSYTGDPI